jgi:hypothetical protein
MKTTKSLLMLALAAMIVPLAIFTACQQSPSSSAPSPSATAVLTASVEKPIKSDVNNSFEMGVIAVETDLFQWPATAAIPTTGLAETPVGLFGPGPQAIAIGSCYYHTQGALTASNSNYETLTVAKRTNGGSATTIAQATTKLTANGGTGNWTAFTNVPIPLAAAIEYVSPGDSITFTVAETGSGVAVPIGMLACFTTLR